MGGGGPDVTYEAAPAPAPAPTLGATMGEYAAAMPQMYQTQLEYMPKFAQMAQGIAQEAYPETAKLQESLASQAAAGMEEDVPDWMREEYLSGIRANLGTNIGSPIGAEYTSRAMMAQKQDLQNYYRQLGLTVAGRQQLTQAPSYSEMYGGFTPGGAMGYGASTYGTYTGAATQTGIANAQGRMQAQMANLQYGGSPWGEMAGGIIGGAAGAFTGGLGTGIGSSLGSLWGK